MSGVFVMPDLIRQHLPARFQEVEKDGSRIKPGMTITSIAQRISRACALAAA
jgi:hypothetical protein